MSHKYYIVYTFTMDNAENGHAEMKIETDHEINSHDDLIEISREIHKRNNGMVQIAINKVTKVDEFE